MSTKRRGSTTLLAFWPDRGKGPNGQDRCRYCGRAMGPAQSRWCSDSCRSKAIHEFSLCNDPVYQRRAVFKRDRGVCATCGRNMLPAPKTAASSCAGEKDAALPRVATPRLRSLPSGSVHALGDRPHRAGRRRRRWHRLGDLQTLCVPCHKQKTAAMQRRRSNEQKGLQDLFD